MKITTVFLIFVLSIEPASAKTLSACMDANKHSDHQTIEICNSALTANSISTDDGSKIYITQANFLIRNHRLNEAEEILDKAFNLNPKMLENGRYRYNWLRTKGSLYFAKEEFTNAFPFYEQALGVAKIIGDSKIIAITYNDLGAINLDMDNYHQALAWLQKSLDIQYQLDDNYGIAFSLANIAEVYVSLNENEKALEYYNLSLESHKKSLEKDHDNDAFFEAAVAKVYQSLGLLQISTSQFTESQSNLNTALSIYQKLNIKAQEVVVLSALGKMHLKQNNSDQALQLLHHAKAVEATLERQDNLDLKINRVNAYMLTLHWDQAEATALLGLQQAKAKETLDRQVEFLDQLAKIYQQTNRLESAIGYLKKSHALRDELLKSKYNKSRGILLAEIELNQKQREVAKLEKQQRLIELENSKQRLLFVVTGLLLFSSIVYLLYLLKRKGRLKRTIQTDQAAHSNQLGLLKISKDRISTLFKGLDCRYICFDSTGQIHHFSQDLGDWVINQNMQKDFTDIWQLVLPQLDEDENLSIDLSLELNNNLANTIWVHQLDFLDNLMVCLLMNLNDSNALKNAEQIKNYSEFKKQLSEFLHSNSEIPVQKSSQLSAITSNMRTLNKNPATSALPDCSQAEFKKLLVELMITCVETWQKTTGKTNVDLAEKSRLWLVSVEEGHLRTRTMDRYTNINKIPEHPRWRQVIKTAHFILSHCQLSVSERQDLNQKTKQVKQLLHNRATGK